MTTKITLHYNYGYAWSTQNNIRVKGYLFDQQERMYRGKELAEYFSTVRTEADFKAKLIEANGLFSVIIENKKQVFFAVDSSRTFPIFYRVEGENIAISDAANFVDKTALCPESISEFLYTGFVTGSRTLLKNVSQLRSGTYGVFDGQRLDIGTYFSYKTGRQRAESQLELEKELAGIFDTVGQRLIKVLNGRTAVVPLSGGYDSRIIALLLFKNRYPNIISYTYGKPYNPDVVISQKVASTFRMPWHFINYDKKLIDGFVNSEEFQTYFPFCSNFVSGFFTQEYFAIKFLKSNHIIPPDAVIIPGHVSNGLSKAYLAGDLNEENIASKILKIHYILRDHPSTTFEKRILEELGQEGPLIDRFENWNIKERMTKFIVNANRTYEYFGFEHLVPLWDKDLTLFFKDLKPALRLNKNLFLQVLFKYFFEPYQVPFQRPKYPFIIRKGMGAIRRIRRNLMSDDYNFKLIARQFMQDEKLDVRWSNIDVNINTILSSWYIKKISEQYKTSH